MQQALNSIFKQGLIACIRCCHAQSEQFWE